MKYLVGALGIILIPLAVVFVAFRASCSFVNTWAVKGLEDYDE